MGTAMVIGKPAPFVRAFVDAIDEVMREHSPGQGLSVIQRAGLACCLTAMLVTHAIGWARFERASLGPYARAALSWLFRHAKMPGAQLFVASVRMILRHYGLTSGTLVIDATANQRSTAAKTMAHVDKLHEKERGGYIWGQRLVFLLLVTPTISGVENDSCKIPDGSLNALTNRHYQGLWCTLSHRPLSGRRCLCQDMTRSSSVPGVCEP
jgi:hypothetical protein